MQCRNPRRALLSSRDAWSRRPRRSVRLAFPARVTLPQPPTPRRAEAEGGESWGVWDGIEKNGGGQKENEFGKKKKKKCQTVVSRSTVTSRTSARMAWYSLDSWRMVARRARRAAFSSGATPGSGSMRACSKRPAISSRAFKSVGVTSRPLRRRSTSKLNTDSHDTGAFFATNAKGGAPGAPTCAAIAAVPCVSGTGRGEMKRIRTPVVQGVGLCFSCSSPLHPPPHTPAADAARCC